MTLRYELNRKPDKAGFCKIRICYFDKGKRWYQPTVIKVKPDLWDQVTQRVKARHPHHGMLNRQLDLKMAELTIKAFADPTPPQPDAGSFRHYAISCLNKWEQTKSANTIRAYQSMLRKVIEFDAEVKLDQITPDWLVRYEAHSRSQGLNDAGALKRVSFISAVIHEAVKYRKITFNPFQVYDKPVKLNPHKIWLTVDEIARIENLETDAMPVKNVAIWFLFSCYTGLRYSDVEKFDPATQIQEGRIILHTTKTREVVSIKITGKIQGILDRWPDVPVYTNQKCNQYLKALAHVCKINKLLTFHSGRHTFAVQCANLGISAEVTSKLLGHSDLKMTQVYYKIIDERVDREMEKWG